MRTLRRQKHFHYFGVFFNNLYVEELNERHTHEEFLIPVLLLDIDDVRAGLFFALTLLQVHLLTGE